MNAEFKIMECRIKFVGEDGGICHQMVRLFISEFHLLQTASILCAQLAESRTG
jgi:hypothetical protein